jgi:hypothetical protein
LEVLAFYLYGIVEFCSHANESGHVSGAFSDERDEGCHIDESAQTLDLRGSFGDDHSAVTVAHEDNVLESFGGEDELADVIRQGNGSGRTVAATGQVNAPHPDVPSLEQGEHVTPTPRAAPGAVDQNEDWIFHATSSF